MTGKGLSALFFPSSKPLTFSSSFSSPSAPSTPVHHTFSQPMIEETIANAESIIIKWDPNSSSYTKVTSLFQDKRKEAKEYLKRVKDLRRAMHFLVSEDSASVKLVLAQNLMQIAMKRLEKEFNQILSTNRDELDPESVSGPSSDGSRNSDYEDEIRSEDEAEQRTVSESITEVERVSALVMPDLKAIADCMISSGYGTECMRSYQQIRKSIVNEGLDLLGVERFRTSQIHKMNGEALKQIIKNWLSAVKIAVKTVFTREKVFCDFVFSASKRIRESCFSEITKEGASNLFRFLELVVKNKHFPGRVFHLMELYEAISELWEDIESVFNSESTSAIKLQALSSLHKLAHSVSTSLSEFESTIEKDSSKTLAAGSGIHPLTQSTMTYISSLAEYSGILSDILADHPLPRNSPLPESYVENPTSNDGVNPAVSVHLAWLILVLLCKLDNKAKLYKDISLSYLFLANNLQFIINEVRTTQLENILSDEWVARHVKKVKVFALNYEATAWTRVFSSLPEKISSEISPEVAKECFREFNAAFEAAYMKQTSWIVPDRKLSDKLKMSIAQRLVPAYREFYDTCLVMLNWEENLEVLVRFEPDDLENYLSHLFHGSPILGGVSSSSSLYNSQGYTPP